MNAHFVTSYIYKHPKLIHALQFLPPTLSACFQQDSTNSNNEILTQAQAMYWQIFDITLVTSSINYRIFRKGMRITRGPVNTN